MKTSYLTKLTKHYAYDNKIHLKNHCLDESEQMASIENAVHNLRTENNKVYILSSEDSIFCSFLVHEITHTAEHFSCHVFLFQGDKI